MFYNSITLKYVQYLFLDLLPHVFSGHTVASASQFAIFSIWLQENERHDIPKLFAKIKLLKNWKSGWRKRRLLRLLCSVCMCVCACVRACMPSCKCLYQYVCTRVPQLWKSIDRFVPKFCELYVTWGRWNAILSVKTIMKLSDARYCEDVAMLAPLSCSLWEDVWKEAFEK